MRRESVSSKLTEKPKIQEARPGSGWARAPLNCKEETNMEEEEKPKEEEAEKEEETTEETKEEEARV